jgi:hypothetical protein
LLYFVFIVKRFRVFVRRFIKLTQRYKMDTLLTDILVICFNINI